MKKKFLLGIGIMAMCIMILFNVSLITKAIGVDLNLTSLVNIAKADEELPEVIIECSADYHFFSGTCWEINSSYNSETGMHHCSCEWTGSMQDHCSTWMLIGCEMLG